MSNVELRFVTRGDESLFERVDDEVFDEPVDPERLVAYLSEPGHLMILALAGGVVVGQTAAVIHRHPDKPTELYLDEVGVAENYRRQGIARRMVEMMLERGKALGCEEAWVGTEPDNQPARGLYEQRRRAGDEEAGTFVMYEYQL